jgi:hypothetical protein
MQVSGQLHAVAALAPGKESLVPIEEFVDNVILKQSLCRTVPKIL